MTLDNVTAARAIRTALRALAKTDKRLDGAKVRVVCDSFSQGSSIAVRVENYPGDPLADGMRAWIESGQVGSRPIGWKNPAAESLARELYAVVEVHWQADGKNRFVDVYIDGISF